MRTLLLSLALALMVAPGHALAEAGTEVMAEDKAEVMTEGAPPLQLKNAAGETVNLPRRHDGVDIYLFWATWCPYCKAFMPHLQSIRDEYGDAVTIFALQIRDDEDPRPYIEDNGFDFELIPNADAAMAPYGMRSTPGLVLVDGDGQIRFNLYDVVLQDPPGYADLSNRAKAARRGPAWAARLRQEIDAVLAGN